LIRDIVAEVRRREYPDPPRGPFFNTASWGLVPRSAAVEAADLTLRRNRTHGFEEAELGVAQRRCRQALAQLLEVSTDEIALTPNTSFGVNLGAALVASGPPGRIVVSEGEFPANVFPWMALEDRGFDVELVPADALGRPREEALLAALDGPGVRALAISAVQFATGYRADLEPLGRACRDRDILFCVDAIQALGAVPFHPETVHVDVLACGGQKWLCAPWGSGFAYVRRELVGRIAPPMVSWLAVKGGAHLEDMLHYRMEWLDTARRFELATLGIQDYVGLARSVEILLEMGMNEVRHHLLDVHAPLVDWIASRTDVTPVTPLDEAHRAGIMTFTLPGLESATQALRSIRAVFSVREGAIRLAPHFYTTREEMEAAVWALETASSP
jgi:selenocysteine lyase/cysteine desulfurase